MILLTNPLAHRNYTDECKRLNWCFTNILLLV